ncbi:migration and invasion enhancer 1 [Brachionus plicatilis]|uniref:Migration and invasion enhancer 1 n=1 Tax=Brachionus plicatilis TaxID=10195 RepID=A0A3M7Q8D4_BRAPC|nr:migration and invasion enhancer 1 [Brachionus plicatilis]
MYKKHYKKALNLFKSKSNIGYGSRFRELQRTILAEVPNAQVTGSVGRSASFEVTVNGNLVFSKLQKGSFPNFDDIAMQVAEIAGK